MIGRLYQQKKPLFLAGWIVVVVSAIGLIVAACAAPSNAAVQAPPPVVAVLAPGVDPGMKVKVAVSKPANGVYFDAGERAKITVTLNDNYGGALSREDMAKLNLYVYGPQDPTKTVTAVKMLNASTDRSTTVPPKPHHYIDLLTAPNVSVDGNVVTYVLQPITNEDAGTYTASVNAVKKGETSANQTFVLADFQLATATVEKPVTAKENCAVCHQGTDSGQLYFHHVDPSARDAYGSPAIDALPLGTCKSCHNNEGYAAYTSPVDGVTKVPDPIVFRVHGVHNGEELKNPANNDPKTGIFKNYTGVVFPANVENCTVCHTNDSWKTKPSMAACGSCHDNIWWGETAAMPKGYVAHPEGPADVDARCASCHTPDVGDKNASPISEAHKVSQKMNAIDVKMTAPRNGKFYAAGEAPTLTLVIKDDKGAAIDHTAVSTSTFSTAGVFVYGPRARALPVLTTTSANGISNIKATLSSFVAATGNPKGWTFAGGATFKIALNGAPAQEFAAPLGFQTIDQVTAWLKANLKDAAITNNPTAGSVTITSNVQGEKSRIEIYNSGVTETMGWKRPGLDIIEHGKVVGKTSGDTAEPRVVTAGLSTASNDLRSDPKAIRTAANITYQLSDVAGLKPGTYMVYVYVTPNGVLAGTGAGPTGQPAAAAKALNVSRTGIGFMTFQVGTETVEKKIATNCNTCHGDTIWHLDEGPIHAEPFDTDYCLACHDYSRYGQGDSFSRVGGNSTSGWAGYGAKPIDARVHGVHRGAYLDHPEEVYEGNPNMASEIIFPQDIRNCTVCHDTKTTSGSWKAEPSRRACLACHDDASARTHAALMTQDPTPADPYGADAVETCKTCHGAGKEASPDKAHNVRNPYKPPYEREPGA